MKVKILNKEVLTNLYKNHGEFARTCYDTPEKYAEKVGEACNESGHMSGSRCEYIKFRIDGIDRGTAEQCMRHEIGVRIPFDESDNYSFADYSEMVTDINPNNVVKNLASFRYIAKSGFEYAIPKEVRACKTADAVYKKIMREINKTRDSIQNELEEFGVTKRRAVECANMILPRATTTSLTIGFTPEALIHFMHKRLCKRAQPEIREIALLMKEAVEAVNPVFAAELIPHCEYLMWCPEGKMSCNKYPTKEKLKDFIKERKEKK